MAMKDINYLIHWDDVRKELLDRERINSRKDTTVELVKCAGICLKKAESLAAPKIVCIEKKVDSLRGGIIALEGGIRLHTGSVSSYLNGAQALCIFLATIGSGIEETATCLMSKGDGLEGYLMDRIGSFAVESLAQDFEEKLRESYSKEDKSVSMRFSAGYCDWAIEEQSALDKALDFSSAGIHLTKSYMMVPKKSISAIVGIGPKGLFPEKRSSPCSICDEKDCGYRRAP